MAEADGGYSGEPFYIKIPKDSLSHEEIKMKTIPKSHHETADRWLQTFQILKKAFCNNLIKHSSSFWAVAVITQINIENGLPLFDIEYVDTVQNDV